MTTQKKSKKFAFTVVMLLAISFLFGGATAFVTYATGKEVAYIPYMAMVSHTEYRFDEPGQIIARIVDFQGSPVSVTNCTATILYPDKTIFVNEALMTPSVNISGDYYYLFTTPNGPEGTYEYQATCNYGGGGANSRSVTNSFHLSSAFTSVLGNLTDIQTDLDGVDTSLTNVLNNLTVIQGDLTQLSTDLFAVNESLSVRIDGVSTQITNLGDQLNDNTTQILNELSAVNSSLYTEITGITSSVLAALEQTALYITEEDQTAAVDSNLWFAASTDVNLALVGDGSAMQFAGGCPLGGHCYNLSGTDAYMVLNHSTWAASSAEHYDDVTYEVWVYDQPGVVDDWYVIIQDSEAQDFTIYMEATSTVVPGETLPDYSFSFGSGTQTRFNSRTEGWHLFQFYFNNYNGTHADVYAYVDGIEARSEQGVNVVGLTDFSVAQFTGPGLYVDNMRIYEGEPDATSVLAKKAKDTLTNTESIITTLSSVQTTLTELQVTQTQINNTVNGISTGLTDFRAVYDGNVTLQNALLTAINATTVDTYSYMTGTLATNVDDALTQLGIINATVNRIETTTGQINSTVNQILENQENEVFMDVFSG